MQSTNFEKKQRPNRMRDRMSHAEREAKRTRKARRPRPSKFDMAYGEEG
jgi:hypothetical protein